MPLKKGLKKVAIIGSGPIVIGQACEFDYSGVQACKALMGLGLEVVLINSNPATIMTDPETASKVYIEPLSFDYVKKILEKERPQALISTLGGQTALNLSIELADKGVLKKCNIELLGASVDVIRSVEDRERFAALLSRLGSRYAKSQLVKNIKQGLSAMRELGFPLVLRPNFTLGGSGGGVVYSLDEFQQRLFAALSESPTSEVLVEASLLGWKEFELEVMRDNQGTFVVICSIENIDPCGVHTGDSVTVAPQMTLSDREYQAMRDEARKIIEEIGLETGGANIQFAVHPQTGQRLVIEVNPRVSRSSALASKATGFPIAKISALLAVGFTLDEITNDITKATPSCYEPALDYVVTKMPRFDFQKYPGVEDILGTQMQSVGEVMAIGRTFKESFQKARQSLEVKRLDCHLNFSEEQLTYPNSRRMDYVLEAFRRGYSVKTLNHLTHIDSWFLDQFSQIVELEKTFKDKKHWNNHFIHQAKRFGFSDKDIARGFQIKEQNVYQFRKKHNIRPSFYRVDTCAGEFKSDTPYYYSTYWGEGASPLKTKKASIAVIGSGPNRIGQGVEFDYNCVRGVKTLKRLGYEAILINSNPETVSTDYDTSDQLFFEPVTLECVREVLRFTRPKGFIPQLGGQTPFEMVSALYKEGYKVLGSSIKTIDLAEDRGRFAKLCSQFGFKIPKSALVSDLKSALTATQELSYPLICRPSYVLGGRRMEIVENQEELQDYFHRHGQLVFKNQPCLMEEYLEDFRELDVDLVKGVNWSLIGGVIEHIESTGVHSGDSMGVIPLQTLKSDILEKVEILSLRLADELKILGFLNLQLAVKGDIIYMIEANPRSSRSVPFISKATGIPLGDLGVSAIMGRKKAEVHPENYDWKKISQVFVKGVVFPFKKFKKADSLLGPEMKSIGEVMGRGENYSEALIKALLSSQFKLPKKGEVFLSLRDRDKELLLEDIKKLSNLSYKFSATKGTAEWLQSHGIKCLKVKKVHEGRPHCVDRITSGQVSLVFNTTSGKSSIDASFSIRRSCIDHGVPCLTHINSIRAFVLALSSGSQKNFSVKYLNEGK